jgi:hypothetical protein
LRRRRDRGQGRRHGVQAAVNRIGKTGQSQQKGWTCAAVRRRCLERCRCMEAWRGDLAPAESRLSRCQIRGTAVLSRAQGGRAICCLQVEIPRGCASVCTGWGRGKSELEAPERDNATRLRRKLRRAVRQPSPEVWRPLGPATATPRVW